MTYRAWVASARALKRAGAGAKQLVQAWGMSSAAAQAFGMAHDAYTAALFEAIESTVMFASTTYVYMLIHMSLSRLQSSKH